ncbi:MAG: aminopeptidase P family N-terminal domain-containing protein [Firmicutes bacterium]|nr:aminopeptidase P family N-terminal domain-containing protein [Bacillota bacterium]
MRKELSALREKMAAESWDVVIIPTGDFHGSEYINDYFKTRKYISGFTGSAGTLVVAKDWAGLWTDGRYFLQASMQLEGTGIDLMKMAEPGVPTVTEWLASYLRPGMVLEFDGRVVSAAAGEAYAGAAEEAGASVIFDKDPADGIWQDRPALTGK